MTKDLLNRLQEAEETPFKPASKEEMANRKALIPKTRAKFVTFIIHSNKKWSQRKIDNYVAWFTSWCAEEDCYLDDVLEED